MDDFQGNSGRNRRHGDRARLETFGCLGYSKVPIGHAMGNIWVKNVKKLLRDTVTELRLVNRNTEQLKVIEGFFAIHLYLSW